MRDIILKNSTLLYDDKWLQLRSIKNEDKRILGYTYSHEVRCDGNIVAILPYRIKDGIVEILFRFEATPCWEMDINVMSSLTGGVDPGDSIEKTVIKELKEESGYVINKNELIELGTSFGIKSSDTIYHLFAVDLTDRERDQELEVENDLEEQSYCEWLPIDDALYECRDPFVAQMYTRLVKLRTGV